MSPETADRGFKFYSWRVSNIERRPVFQNSEIWREFSSTICHQKQRMEGLRVFCGCECNLDHTNREGRILHLTLLFSSHSELLVWIVGYTHGPSSSRCNRVCSGTLCPGRFVNMQIIYCKVKGTDRQILRWCPMYSYMENIVAVEYPHCCWLCCYNRTQRSVGHIRATFLVENPALHSEDFVQGV